VALKSSPVYCPCPYSHVALKLEHSVKLEGHFNMQPGSITADQWDSRLGNVQCLVPLERAGRNRTLLLFRRVEWPTDWNTSVA